MVLEIPEDTVPPHYGHFPVIHEGINMVPQGVGVHAGFPGQPGKIYTRVILYNPENQAPLGMIENI